jgi:hypothetical protein
MKWYVFTAACVVVLIALGIAAVDAADVAWEGRTPVCPHCRAEVNNLAVFCSTCDRVFDWEQHTEECRWCLSRDDARHLRDVFAALDFEDEEEPYPEPLSDFPKAYFRAMEEGVCTYCAGLGHVMEGEAKVGCPVCRGRGDCVACNGDRIVVIGSAAAHRTRIARRDDWVRAERRARLTGLPLRRSLLIDEDVKLLAGFAEAESILDERGKPLLNLARQRVREAFFALHEMMAVRHTDRERMPASEPADEAGS